jgi:hypothetical protein
MTLLNLLIIYFACGAPFGVYQMTRNEGPRSASEWLIAAAVFILWPVFLLMFAIERLRPAVVSQKNRVEQIRTDIEKLAFPEGSTTSLFEFREVLYRYTGLIGSDVDPKAEHPFGELLTVAGRQPDDASLTCLLRRNREKIEFHKTLARDEFIDLITDMLQPPRPDSDQVLVHAIELSRIINDPTATDDLSALQSSLAAADRAVTPPASKEVWKAQAHSASNIS